MTWGLVFEQLLNGLQYGVMLFLMAAGLTLVLGIMNMVNLAHGSLYMVGAYLAVALTGWTGNYFAGVALALLGTLLVGMAIEVVTLRTLYNRDHLDQVLATFGLILFFNELVSMIWGRGAQYASLPAWLQGHIDLFTGSRYPVYRVAILVVGLLVAILLWYVVTRTRLGMLVRAGASKPPERATIVDSANGQQADAQWAEGADSAGWPAGLALRADATYYVLLPDRPRRQITLRVLDRLPDEDDVLTELQRRGCSGQFAAWVRGKLAAAK